MPEIVWTRTFDGEQPHCILGEDRILIHFTAENNPVAFWERIASLVTSRPAPKKHLICLDMTGHTLWSQPECSVLVTLPSKQFLLNTPDGTPIIVDGNGKVCRRWTRPGIERVQRHGRLLLMASKHAVELVDLELNPIWHLESSRAASLPLDCFVEGSLYWVEESHLNVVDQNGRFETSWPLPETLINVTMDEYEKATGKSALSGWTASLNDPSATVKAFVKGDRPTFYYWRLSFDEAEDRFFLVNGMAPHMIASIDRSGKPHWCKYLNFACCGGLPYPIGNGLYVTSSGCGGILSWFDKYGNILFQSEPQEGVGLASAFSNEITVLPNGNCLVGGGPGVVAFSSSGEQLWHYNHDYSVFHWDPGNELLIGCFWRRGKGSTPSQSFLEVSHSL